MRFTIKKRGAIVLSLWAALAMAVLSFILFVFFSSGWWVWWSLVAVPIPAYIGFYYYLKNIKILIKGHELIITKGNMFTNTQRVALKNVVGVSTFNTPVQHLLGLSSLLVHTSGTTIIIFALSKQDALSFSSKVLHTGACP